MQNFNHSLEKLDNETLLQRTKSLAAEERKVTLEILHHLQEISRRRLFATRGYSSLFEYATQELGYSDAAAQRRIAAARLLSEVPETEEKIAEGKMTLSTAAQAQKLFQAEAKLNKPFALEEKQKILETLIDLSSRQAEQKLIQHSSQPISIQRPDQIKPVTPTHSEIRFIADQALLDQLELIRGLLANKNPHLSLSELIAEMAKLSLAKLQPKPPKIQENQQDFSDAGVKRNQNASDTPNDDLRRFAEKTGAQAPSRYIPVEVKRVVYQRDQGKCQYRDRKTGHQCGSTHAVQYDHVVPFALGGPTTVENLQLKCRMHNRILAVESFGRKKMATYLRLD